MKKEYIYDPKIYFRHITLTACFCAVLFLVSLVLICLNISRNIFILAAIVSGYTVWNAFISRSNPAKIILEEDGISFESYGRTDKYLFKDITLFLAKDFRGSGKIYLRINQHTFFRGRYWIHTRECNDSDELYLFILKLEYKTHPGSIKAKAWDSTRPNVNKMPVLPWNLPIKETVQEGETV